MLAKLRSKSLCPNHVRVSILQLSVGLLKNLYPANVVNFLVPDLKESSTPSVASRHGCDPLDTAALGGPLQLAAQGQQSHPFPRRKCSLENLGRGLNICEPVGEMGAHE